MKKIYCRFVMKAADDEQGTIEGYASVYGNVDTQGDIVVKGAFKRSIDAFNASLATGKQPNLPLCWQHDHTDPMGPIIAMQETDRGLYIKAQLVLESPEARQRYGLAKTGAVQNFSICGPIIQAELNDQNQQLLKEIALREVSLVTFPANTQASVTAVKTDTVEDTIMPMTLAAELLRLHPTRTGHLAHKSIAGVAQTMDFEQRRSELNSRQWDLRYAIRNVIDAIMDDTTLTAEQRTTAMTNALDEYKALMLTWVTEWSALQAEMAAANLEGMSDGSAPTTQKSEADPVTTIPPVPEEDPAPATLPDPTSTPSPDPGDHSADLTMPEFSEEKLANLQPTDLDAMAKSLQLTAIETARIMGATNGEYMVNTIKDFAITVKEQSELADLRAFTSTITK